LSSAQSNCPQGFAFAGILSGVGSPSEEFNKSVALKLREGATLDESFQQAKVRATNAKGKANLRPEDIPKGILIIPHGSNDPEVVWSVSEPKLTKIKDEDDNGISSARYEFGMRLFCKVQTSPYDQQSSGCNVEVEVCYKLKSKN